MPEPLTQYLDLLRAVLARARADGFAHREPLQLALWLVYRILDLDFRCMDAYLFLAYLFCLLQDWTRAGQVLLHADRLQPGHPQVQAMLTQVRFTLQNPLPVGPQPDISGADPVSQLAVSVSLPDLHSLRKQIEQDLPPAAELLQRYEKLNPVLKSLAREIKDLS